MPKFALQGTSGPPPERRLPPHASAASGISGEDRPRLDSPQVPRRRPSRERSEGASPVVLLRADPEARPASAIARLPIGNSKTKTSPSGRQRRSISRSSRSFPRRQGRHAKPPRPHIPARSFLFQTGENPFGLDARSSSTSAAIRRSSSTLGSRVEDVEDEVGLADLGEGRAKRGDEGGEAAANENRRCPGRWRREPEDPPARGTRESRVATSRSAA